MNTQLTDAEIDALDGRFMSFYIARDVMGWKKVQRDNEWWEEAGGTCRYRSDNGDELEKPFRPDIDANAMREVETEIERRDKSSEFDYGLLSSYCGYLCEYTMGEGVWGHQDIDVRIFAMITASPAARCRAALKAVRE